MHSHWRTDRRFGKQKLIPCQMIAIATVSVMPLAPARLTVAVVCSRWTNTVFATDEGSFPAVVARPRKQYTNGRLLSTHSLRALVHWPNICRAPMRTRNKLFQIVYEMSILYICLPLGSSKSAGYNIVYIVQLLLLIATLFTLALAHNAAGPTDRALNFTSNCKSVD